MFTIEEQAKKSRNSFLLLNGIGTQKKNEAVNNIADLIKRNQKEILAANNKDLLAARRNNLPESLYNRLGLNKKKIEQIILSLKGVAALEDPVGKVLMKRELDDSLFLCKIVVPIGVIGVIFESRPDALVQISSLCVKTGNSAILKGGSEALFTNRILFKYITRGLLSVDKRFENALQLVESRDDVKELLKYDKYIDLIIPRGSNSLVRMIKENTRIPVLGHADGICHLYVDKNADIEMAVKIAVDSKCQYPAVCNSIETLLVHSDIAKKYLPELLKKMPEVRLLGDSKVKKIIDVELAVEKDWSEEYNNLTLSIKVIESSEEAVNHINYYGSGHTDSIVTKDNKEAEYFLSAVDSSSVMWNCSTRFSDGYRYGFGAEVGISTNKIHARGPVGMEGLTIYKYRVTGNGNIVSDYTEGKSQFSIKDL